MPFLENDSVLNVKFQSMGSIPSIKPVSIDDNFKEFVMDILNSGQVNQKHYNSLTEAEKAHFHKIVKGAGLTNTLKFKPDDKIDDKKDVKRIDVLVGQIIAGNDNDKVFKEAKELIKKCVANGSITKHKAMDLLFQIE
jgi:hemerythrin superfamily protein